MPPTPPSRDSVPNGRFITFEGGEGAGKSTQIRKLADRLEARGIAVLTTREPGGSERAEALRALLLAGRAAPFGTFAEAVLFSAARSDHVRATIAPALQRGLFVLCDRFADSTRVYQGASGEVPDRVIRALEHSAIGAIRPDLTLILDCPVAIGGRRAAARRQALGAATDSFEGRDTAFHERVRAGFLRLAADEPARCVVVQADRGADEIDERIWSIVRERWALPGLGRDGV